LSVVVFLFLLLLSVGAASVSGLW